MEHNSISNKYANRKKAIHTYIGSEGETFY